MGRHRISFKDLCVCVINNFNITESFFFTTGLSNIGYIILNVIFCMFFCWNDKYPLLNKIHYLLEFVHILAFPHVQLPFYMASSSLYFI